MDTRIAKATLDVIRKERERRVANLPDHEDVAYDQWLFSDEPFINELCLILLVALRHQVEREIVRLLARVADGAATLKHDDYLQALKNARKQCEHSLKPAEGPLRLRSFADWDGAMNTLRLLANRYKHNPPESPESDLLRHLKLDEAKNYAPLPESDGIREGLAISLALPPAADYCEIADEFVRRAERFILEVTNQPIFAKVVSGAVSLNPRDFLH